MTSSPVVAWAPLPTPVSALLLGDSGVQELQATNIMTSSPVVAWAPLPTPVSALRRAIQGGKELQATNIMNLSPCGGWAPLPTPCPWPAVGYSFARTSSYEHHDLIPCGGLGSLATSSTSPAVGRFRGAGASSNKHHDLIPCGGMAPLPPTLPPLLLGASGVQELQETNIMTSSPVVAWLPCQLLYLPCCWALQGCRSFKQQTS
eukprot:gene9190-16330_t